MLYIYNSLRTQVSVSCHELIVLADRSQHRLLVWTMRIDVFQTIGVNNGIDLLLGVIKDSAGEFIFMLWYF